MPYFILDKKSLSVLFLFALLSSCQTEKKKLPILGNRETVETVVDGKTIVDTIYKIIPQFSFLNQDSILISNDTFKGKIYVADFFFTSCPSICPEMHRNMLNVYNKFKDNSNVMFLSHSIDYKRDKPAILKQYATKLGVTNTQWQFATGSKDSIYSIAEKGYMAGVGEDKNEPGGFVHQGWFILVDKEKRLRGAYDGTDETQVENLMRDMEILLDEYEK